MNTKYRYVYLLFIYFVTKILMEIFSRIRKRAKSVFEKIVGKGLNLFVTYTRSLSCLAVTAGAHVRIWELEQPVTNSPSDGKSVPNFCGFFC